MSPSLARARGATRVLQPGRFKRCKNHGQQGAEANSPVVLGACLGTGQKRGMGGTPAVAWWVPAVGFQFGKPKESIPFLLLHDGRLGQISLLRIQTGILVKERRVGKSAGRVVRTSGGTEITQVHCAACHFLHSDSQQMSPNRYGKLARFGSKHFFLWRPCASEALLCCCSSVTWCVVLASCGSSEACRKSP